MRLLPRLCIVIGLGVALTGSQPAAPSASATSEPVRAATVHRGAAFSPVPTGGVPDEDEPEETSCPDWRRRQ